jgi:hypothetical protein
MIVNKGEIRYFKKGGTERERTTKESVVWIKKYES